MKISVLVALSPSKNKFAIKLSNNNVGPSTSLYAGFHACLVFKKSGARSHDVIDVSLSLHHILHTKTVTIRYVTICDSSFTHPFHSIIKIRKYSYLTMSSAQLHRVSCSASIAEATKEIYIYNGRPFMAVSS